MRQKAKANIVSGEAKKAVHKGKTRQWFIFLSGLRQQVLTGPDTSDRIWLFQEVLTKTTQAARNCRAHFHALSFRTLSLYLWPQRGGGRQGP